MNNTLILFLYFLITTTFISSSGNNNVPTDLSVNCGSTGTAAAQDGRQWIGDVIEQEHEAFLQMRGSSAATKKKLFSADPVPHKSARVSRYQFSYAFGVSTGQKILRLHFNPSTARRGLKGLKDLFTVEAGPFILLSNFSASLAADALRVKSFAKEFCLDVPENQQLNLTFTPETSQSLGTTYAFINGIEIISVPAGFSYFQGGDRHTALEIVHRSDTQLRRPVMSSRDSGGLFPKWATHKAERLKNDTWNIALDVGFRYMIRFHFSEMGLKVVGSGDVMFNLLVNGMIVQTNSDLVKERDVGNRIPRYKDYMVMMRGKKKEGKRNLSISLDSYDDLRDGLGILSGFEVFKLSNPDNSLASPNPMPPPHGSSAKTFLISLSGLMSRNTFAFVAITIISLANIIVHKLVEYSEANCTEEINKPSARAERLCRRFTLAEIQLATRNFSDTLVIGRGGFGRVYKGLIDRGHATVAVKRLKSDSMQGAHEFLMEIETLSELRHANLVSLIGYCNEHREMILVYDYMAGGTLSDQLYKLQCRESNNSFSLTWKQRLNICIGAGRGLDYLHTGHGVIHRDVKTSNILLDENLVAKVSDFGLAKHEDRIKLQSHVSTRVKGTKGYLDPHYLHTRRLTRKTDTYAFGVVLFEILCGRRAVDFSVAEDEHILTIWARGKINKGETDEIVDLSLREEISPASLKTFVGIAERCLREDPKNRPTMSQVVQQIDLALDQQENKHVSVLNDETELVSKEQSTMAPRHQTTLPVEQTNIQADINATTGIPSVTRDARTSTALKPLRLWPWDAIWNRVIQSNKNDLLSEAWDETNIRSTNFDWAATNFWEAIAIGSHHQGKLIRILVYSVEAGSCATPECQGILKRLRDCANETFLEFENAIASDTTTSAFPGGGVHPLTIGVMNHIKTLMDYSKTLGEDSMDQDSLPVSPGSPMSKHFQSLISVLESNLDKKSYLYKDESLQHLFLMNNVHYVSEKVRNSKLRTLLGDWWVRKHLRKIEQHAMNYEIATWSSILSLLNDGGTQKPGSSNISRTLVKEKLHGFYFAFEEVYKSQTGWSIPDRQLRDDLRVSISVKVILAYRTFVGRLADFISAKHMKYTPDDLEDYMFDLFEGSQKSLHGGGHKK